LDHQRVDPEGSTGSVREGWRSGSGPLPAPPEQLREGERMFWVEVFRAPSHIPITPVLRIPRRFHYVPKMPRFGICEPGCRKHLVRAQITPDLHHETLVEADRGGEHRTGAKLRDQSDEEHRTEQLHKLFYPARFC